MELHPHLQQRRLQDYCRSRGILLQAYGSLQPLKVKDMADGPLVKAAAAMAARLGCEPEVGHHDADILVADHGTDYSS